MKDFLNKEKRFTKLFDTKYLKNINHLSAEDIEIISEWSFVSFVPIGFFWYRQWEFFFGFILLQIADFLSVNQISFVIPILFFILAIFMMIFSIKHGGRLAWNRSNFSAEEFKEFKRKYKKWDNVGIAFFVISLLVLVTTLSEMFMI